MKAIGGTTSAAARFWWSGTLTLRVHQMEDLAQLHAKLDRAQAVIEKGIGHLTNQRALFADRLAEGRELTQSHDLLSKLEDIQFLHVRDRDRLRRELDGAIAGKKLRLIR
jgi:hypothetical protein